MLEEAGIAALLKSDLIFCPLISQEPNLGVVWFVTVVCTCADVI